MFEVIKQEVNNPFKPEIIDSTTIVLKQSKPFVQISYKYEGDLTGLTDDEAINKVLEDFYEEHFNEKIQEGKVTELELAFAKQKENLEQQLNDLGLQNELISQALFEITELLMVEEDEPADEEPEDSNEEDLEGPEEVDESETEEPIEEEHENPDESVEEKPEDEEPLEKEEEGGADESNELTDGD